MAEQVVGSGGSGPMAPPAPYVEPPHSIAQTRVDDKGRLKLPAEFLEYLKNLKVERVFVTTIDKRIVRLYPISVWKTNENLFENAGDDAETAEDVAYVAKHYGGDSDIDSQGRVLIPSLIRSLLDLESQTVFVDHYHGRINVSTKAIHEEKLNRAFANLGDKVKALEKKGLK